MQVTYVSPSRAHHYGYALALHRAGCLKRFISGVSRLSPRSPLPELGDKVVRADLIQNIYLASLKLKLPVGVTDELAYLSKLWLDYQAETDARHSDIFLFYNGAGLGTVKKLAGTPTHTVVEAVTSHVLVQEKLLREEHEQLGLPFRPFHRREVRRRLEEYQRADAIICPSLFSRRSFLEQGIPEERLFVVPYGIAAVRPALDSTAPEDVFRVLYVGQIQVRKGLRYLLQAFEQLKHPRKELWLVGPMGRVTGIEDIQLPEGVRFLGVQRGEELARAYASCHAFVLPTIEDGFGLVIGEALSHGVPVIATVNSGAPDCYQDGKEGFIVPIRSPEAIREKLQLLADDPALRRDMALKARSMGPHSHGWDATYEKLLQALNSIKSLPKV